MSRLLNVYIQTDNWEKLSQEENKARLINDLLREYFRKLDINSLSLKELKKAKEIAQLKREQETKLQEIEEKYK